MLLPSFFSFSPLLCSYYPVTICLSVSPVPLFVYSSVLLPSRAEVVYVAEKMWCANVWLPEHMDTRLFFADHQAMTQLQFSLLSFLGACSPNVCPLPSLSDPPTHVYQAPRVILPFFWHASLCPCLPFSPTPSFLTLLGKCLSFLRHWRPVV